MNIENLLFSVGHYENTNIECDVMHMNDVLLNHYYKISLLIFQSCENGGRWNN